MPSATIPTLPSESNGIGRADPRVERQCRYCGCTEHNPCVDSSLHITRGCGWATPTMCSTCQRFISAALEFLECTRADDGHVVDLIDELLTERRKIGFDLLADKRRRRR